MCVSGLTVEKPVESMVTSRKNGGSSESSGSSSDSEAEVTGNRQQICFIKHSVDRRTHFIAKSLFLF